MRVGLALRGDGAAALKGETTAVIGRGALWDAPAVCAAPKSPEQIEKKKRPQASRPAYRSDRTPAEADQ
jgi:hypothetical protein